MASLLLVVLAYFATGWLGLQILTAGSYFTLVWLPAGIAVAAMLQWGWGVWPAVCLGAFLVNLSMGSSWPLAAAFAVGNTLGPLVTVGLLKRIGFQSPVDYFQRNPGVFIPPIRSAPVLATVILLAVSGVASAQQDPGKPLVVGSEEDYPPFAIGKTDEAAGGFTVELWKVVAAENGLNYAIRVLPFRELLEEFEAGKVDVMINLAQSEERRAYADFSVPHVIVNGAVFVRKDESRIRSEADLVGKSIIVLNSDLAHDYAISKAWKQQLVLVDTVADGLKLLASGQHDAMLLSTLAGMQTLLALKIRNIKALDANAGFSQRFSFAVHKGNAELLAKINEGLYLTKSSGAYDALYEKWFGVFEPKEISFQQMLKYLGPITFVFLVFAGFLLVRQNERRKGVEALRRSHESLELRVAERTAEIDQAELNQRTIVESLPQLVWTCDAKGNCDWLGKQWVDYTGLPAAGQLGYGWTNQVHPDDRAHATAIWHSALSSGSFFDAEFRVRRHDGEYRWFKTRAAPLRDDAGRVMRWFGTNTDIHDRREQQVILEDRVDERTAALKQAEEQMRSKNTVLEGVTQVQRQFLIETDPRQMFDQMLALLLEITASEYGFIGEILRQPSGQPYLRSLSLTNIAWNDETRAFYEQNVQTGLEFHNLNTLFGAVMTTRETVIANDPAHDPRRGGLPPGHPSLGAFLGMPFFHGNDVTGMVGLANRAGGYDQQLVQSLAPILATCSSLVLAYTLESKRKRAEEQLRSALMEKEVLLKEIYHRVKNNLQVVSSLLNLQSRRVTDAGAKQLLDDSANRVKSMALVHEHLYRAENLSSIELPAYMKQLTDNLKNANQPLSSRVQLRLEMDELTVGVESAIPLGLVVNELVSNAYRHGYQTDETGGEIVVRVTGLPGEQIRLEVKDDGCGLPADFEPAKGGSMGMQLVVTLSEQLGGELTWDAGHQGAFFALQFKREISAARQMVT